MTIELSNDDLNFSNAYRLLTEQLREEHWQAVKLYKSGDAPGDRHVPDFFESLNRALREGGTLNSDQQFVCDQLDQAFELFIAGEELHLYRGLALSAQDLEALKRSGESLVQLAYQSCSLDSNSAHRFARQQPRWLTPVVLHLYVPRGLPILPIASQTGHNDLEGEVLLPRGCQLVPRVAVVSGSGLATQQNEFEVDVLPTT